MYSCILFHNFNSTNFFKFERGPQIADLDANVGVRDQNWRTWQIILYIIGKF